MKKLISMLVVTVMLLSCVAVNAAVEPVTLYPDSQGLYSMDYTLSNAGVASAKDGDMYGLVVVEAAESVENFTLDQSAIRYIDQGEASNGKLVFDTEKFGPKALTTETNKYLMYIGGEGLEKATYIGELSQDPPAVKSITISPKTANVNVEGGSVTFTAKVIDELNNEVASPSITWSTDNDAATVENGVVTVGELTAGTVITVTATVAENIADTATITVVEKPAYTCGDANEDGAVDLIDATFVTRYAFGWTEPIYTSINMDAADVNLSGMPVDLVDATILTRHAFGWTENGYGTLPYVAPTN